jgi:hypothetical protein
VKNYVSWLSLLFVLSIVPAKLPAQSVPTTAGGNPENEMTMSHHRAMDMDMHHDHGAAIPVSYADLTKATTLLETARHATEKYKDVRVAEEDGYGQIGPDVPGMGIHFVGTRIGSAFDIERPSILLYERDAAAANGYALVGVSYLLNAVEGADGQPADPPFPKSLARWHRHANICVLANRSVKTDLTADQCESEGGHFTAETQWMIHAWIWKDSPAGVFSGTNPAVQ